MVCLEKYPIGLDDGSGLLYERKKHKGYHQGFGLSNYCYEEAQRRNGFGEENQEFCFGHIKFKAKEYIQNQAPGI